MRQHGKVNDTFVQLFRNLLGIAAGDMIMQTGAAFLEPSDCGGEIPDLVRFGQAEINIAAQNII